VLSDYCIDNDFSAKKDIDDQTFHLGAFDKSKLVSVASFYFKKNSKIEGDYHYQLTGMATLPEYQKKGHSRELLNAAFPIIKQNFCSVVWCKTHGEASGFYEKVGFIDANIESCSHGHDEHKHNLMFKEIN
jgi:GNAT superfamily N-acetyltransferase